ncbi:MAG: hypothetical protein ACI8PT_004576, partial [Gammaproteobacteria bacterium]
ETLVRANGHYANLVNGIAHSSEPDALPV